MILHRQIRCALIGGLKFEMVNGVVHWVKGAPPPKRNKCELQKRNLVHPVRSNFEDIESTMPEESDAMNAGCIFAPGMYANEVPPDPEISFWGEEMTASMRAWTRGWRFYAPKKWIAAHRYLRAGKVHRIQDSKRLYAHLSAVSHDKQMSIWLENDLGCMVLLIKVPLKSILILLVLI